MPKRKMVSAEGLEAVVREGLGRRREKATVDIYCGVLRRFCQSTGKAGEWERRDFLRYFDKLIDGGKATKTVLDTFSALKVCFKVIGIPYPVTLDDLPRGRPQQQVRIATGKENIQSLIDYVKSDGNYEEQLYLAVSSVYGLRRVELSRLVMASFEYPKLHVDTAKHGIPRDHYIPDFLWRWIEPGVSGLDRDWETTQTDS